MTAILLLIAGIAGLSLASQDILSIIPATGNIAYQLPTERTFLLNVPDSYIHGEPHPVVFSFHGGNLNCSLFSSGSCPDVNSWWLQRKAATDH